MNTTTLNTTPIVRRVLTQKESFELLTWYKEHQERLLQMTDAGIVTEAGPALGIVGLNQAHLISARKSLGIQKREQRKSAPPSGDLEALQGLVNEQAEQIVRLSTLTQGLLDRVRKLETTR
jgi:hypothetical protein